MCTSSERLWCCPPDTLLLQMVEFPLSGGAIPSFDLNVLRLRRYMSYEDYSLISLEVIVIIFLLLHTWAEWQQVRRR